MTGRTHIAGGLMFGSAAMLYSQKYIPETNTLMSGIIIGCSTVICSSISALLPDIDKKESIIGRRLWFVSWNFYFLQLLCKIPSLIGIGLFKRSSPMFDHREITHYPITWLLITAMSSLYCYSLQHLDINHATYYILISPAAGLSLGILSHLVLDFFSGKLRLFVPLNYKRIGIPIIKNSGFLDSVILRTLLFLASLKLILKYLYNIFLYNI